MKNKIKLESWLLEKVNDFLRDKSKKIKYSDLNQFVNVAVQNLLKREKDFMNFDNFDNFFKDDGEKK